MGNSLRCCIACVLPCGALDLIRVVHLNGQVDVYSRQVYAKEILDANPGHVLSKPCSQGVSSKIMVVPSTAELKRGSIYFLIPSLAMSEKKCNRMKRESREVVKEEVERRRPGRRKSEASLWTPNLDSIYED